MSRDVTERIVLIKLIYGVVYHGAVDLNEYVTVLAQLEHAIDVELIGVNRFQRDTIARHVVRSVPAILEPYIDRNVDCAKFGLAVIYVIQELTNQGLFEANEAFAKALENYLMTSTGSIVARHSVDAISASAVKMGRRLLVALQSLGYFEQARAAA